MRLLVLITLLLAAACAPLRDGATMDSPQTGIRGVSSAQRVISDHPKHVFVAHAVIAAREGRTAYGVLLGQIRDTTLRRARFDGAFNDGQELPFRGANRTAPYCLSLSCDAWGVGTFAFDAEEFTALAGTGLSALLIGPDIVLDIEVPAAVFADALSRWQQTGWSGTPES